MGSWVMGRKPRVSVYPWCPWRVSLRDELLRGLQVPRWEALSQRLERTAEPGPPQCGRAPRVLPGSPGVSAPAAVSQRLVCRQENPQLPHRLMNMN